jgi:hypothetical protein
MEEMQSQQPSTDSGAKHGTPDEKPAPIPIRLPDLPYLKLGQSEQNAWRAIDEEFVTFAQSLVTIQVQEGDALDRPWTWEDRRDFLNWCIDEGVLSVHDGRLIPVEELIPTAPLPHDTDTRAAPTSANETGFLVDRERARPVIAANPEISAQELADTLGLNSAVYAQTLMVSVNVHQD